MLGITSERFPRSGALGLAWWARPAAFSTALAGPVMAGSMTPTARRTLPVWAILPVVLAAVFTLIHVSDKARGGYRIEQISAAHQ